LEQIAGLLDEDLPLAELRGMLRLKRIETQNQLDEAHTRLGRIEARLQQIEIAGLGSKQDGGGPMRRCPHCGRMIPERETLFCPYCGKPLGQRHADLLPFEKSTRELASRALVPLLVALGLLITVAALAGILTRAGRQSELVSRPIASPTGQDPQLALLYVDQERLEKQGSIVLRGQVRNISDRVLRNIEVVASLYDADPNLLTTQQTLLECVSLLPGQSLAFEVEVDANPRAQYYGLLFQSEANGVIPVRDDRLD